MILTAIYMNIKISRVCLSLNLWDNSYQLKIPTVNHLFSVRTDGTDGKAIW